MLAVLRFSTRDFALRERPIFRAGRYRNGDIHAVCAPMGEAVPILLVLSDNELVSGWHVYPVSSPPSPAGTAAYRVRLQDKELALDLEVAAHTIPREQATLDLLEKRAAEPRYRQLHRWLDGLDRI